VYDKENSGRGGRKKTRIRRGRKIKIALATEKEMKSDIRLIDSGARGKRRSQSEGAGRAKQETRIARFGRYIVEQKGEASNRQAPKRVTPQQKERSVPRHK